MAALGWILNLGFAGSDVIVVSINIPGVEWAVSTERLHWSVDTLRLHWKAESN